MSLSSILVKSGSLSIILTKRVVWGFVILSRVYSVFEISLLGVFLIQDVYTTFLYFLGVMKYIEFFDVSVGENFQVELWQKRRLVQNRLHRLLHGVIHRLLVYA